MNVHEPLKKSWSFERSEGDTMTVHFKYEKVGNLYCVWCSGSH